MIPFEFVGQTHSTRSHRFLLVGKSHINCNPTFFKKIFTELTLQMLPSSVLLLGNIYGGRGEVG